MLSSGGRTGRAHDNLGLAAQFGVLLGAANAPDNQRGPYGRQARGERLHNAVRLLRQLARRHEHQHLRQRVSHSSVTSRQQPGTATTCGARSGRACGALSAGRSSSNAKTANTTVLPVPDLAWATMSAIRQ